MVEAGHKKQTESILSNVKAAYYGNRKEAFDKTDSFISRYVYRVASFYLSVPFIKLGFSANQVTAVSFAFSITAMGFLVSGAQPAVMIGSLIFALAVLLDYVDGNIARLSGRTSHFGKFLDGMVDTLVGTFMPLAVAVGLYRRPDSIMAALGIDSSHSLILLVGALTAVSVSLQALVSYRFRLARCEAQVAENQTPASGAVASRTAAPFFWRAAYAVKFCLKTESYFMLAGMVFFAVLDIMSIYLSIRLLARGLDCLLEILNTFMKARKLLDVAREY